MVGKRSGTRDNTSVRSNSNNTKAFPDILGPVYIADHENGTATHVDGGYSTNCDEGYHEHHLEFRQKDQIRRNNLAFGPGEGHLGESNVPGLLEVARHSGSRSGRAWAKALRTPSTSKSAA